MNKLALLFIFVFMVGDCIRLTGGVFRGSYWTITAINKDGTFDLKDRQWVLKGVRGSYLLATAEDKCL